MIDRLMFFVARDFEKSIFFLACLIRNSGRFLASG
jgi:hypothetical protein